jgi:hypothetical protein
LVHISEFTGKGQDFFQHQELPSPIIINQTYWKSEGKQKGKCTELF